MPYIPHTQADVADMLAQLGVDSIETLFDEIPAAIRCEPFQEIPEGINEFTLLQLAEQRAKQDPTGLCFMGAGAYEHHIPAAVWDITSRGEYLTAYTPYQAEASQGTLQLLYEYQSMMSQLMACEISNASMYDGASALAEAVLMAARIQRKQKQHRMLVLGSLHPAYRRTVEAIVSNQEIELIDVPFDLQRGVVDPQQLADWAGQEVTAVVIQHPNFFGCLEEVDTLTDWAHQQNALVIGCMNPIAAALLKPPGEWGQRGADIACGEGQPLGVPLASGGPYFGFLCCRQVNVRQLPGRLIGRTVDLDGNPGFALTLQAREQHIRRGKATSNICTNQGLLVTAATIHMSLLGAEGLRRVAAQSHANTRALLNELTTITGVEAVFNSAFFHETVIRTPKPAGQVLSALADQSIWGGYDLSVEHPELDNCILICATETKLAADLQYYKTQLQTVLKQ